MMGAFLRHPLTVALIGVAITGGLVPYFARRWQNHQKALEVRVDLAAEISESLMGLVARVESVRDHTKLAQGSGSDEQREKFEKELNLVQDSLDTELLEFEVRKVVIATKLGAYLEDKTIGRRWRDLADATVKHIEANQGANEALLEDLHASKADLTADVLEAPTVFGTSWLPQWFPKKKPSGLEKKPSGPDNTSR
jgi:hypothetical protein